MKLKLAISIIGIVCVFALGTQYGKEKEIKHRNKIKTPTMTAHSSIVSKGSSITEDIIDLGVKVVFNNIKGE